MPTSPPPPAANNTPALEVRGVSHWFGPSKEAGHRVLGGVELTIGRGQIVALVGPSGCGKSTLLRAILGTHPPREGTVSADGNPVTRPGRDVGIVYQHYSLYDFLTARGNVAFGLTLDETTLPQRLFRPLWWREKHRDFLRRADAFLERVNLSDAADRYPHEMSGGMRQRVAVAQAFILEPKVVLLDEPFGALDEATREELQVMLLGFAAENAEAARDGREPPHTILIVTHELNEALYVADRVVGLSQYHPGGADGSKIVYDRPAPHFTPDQPRDYAALVGQREEIRRAVFDPANVERHTEYVTFWKDAGFRRSGCA